VTDRFDELVYMDRLVRAGVQEDQVRAHAWREAVATKADLRNTTIELKSDIRELATRFSVLTWMVGINVALGLGVLGKLLR
jgi:hypothetical protein